MSEEGTSPVRTLKYGREEVAIPALFEGVRFIAPPEPEGIADLSGELHAVLGNPISSPPLREFVAPGDMVTLVVSDITRSAPTSDILPILLEEISHAGQVRILVALGLHRKLDDAELGALLGPEVASSVPVFQHDPTSDGRLIFLGRTRFGTEVQLSRFLLPESTYQPDEEGSEESGLKVVLTGAIKGHYFFGFSGGRKSILPGCASAHSIVQNHLLMLGPDGERVPGCRSGNLAGNPCHADSLDAARLVPNTFVVNTVQTAGNRVCAVVAGDLEQAHLRGCAFYLEKCAEELEERFDVVLASCGGYPRDINFIQGHKAIEHAFRAVKPGGTLVLAARCDEGFGHEEFLEWFRYKEPNDMYEALAKGGHAYGQTAYAALWKAKKVDIVLLSGLNSDDVRRMRITPVGSLDEAADMVRAKYGADFSACVMPCASETLIRDESLKLR